VWSPKSSTSPTFVVVAVVVLLILQVAVVATIIRQTLKWWKAVGVFAGGLKNL